MLKSIVFPEGLKEVESMAFHKCEQLTSIYFGKSIEYLQGDIFCGSGLKEITISPENPYFTSENNCCLSKWQSKLVFGCNTSIIPNEVKTIGAHAFDGCKLLVNINIPSSVTRIEDFAFRDCSGLQRIDVSGQNVFVGKQAFGHCVSISSINIPNLKWIGELAFAGCKNLKDIDISSNVKTIGDVVLSGCVNLKQISYHTNKENPADVESIVNKLLENERKEPLLKLFVPIGCGYAYRHYQFSKPIKEIVTERIQ